MPRKPNATTAVKPTRMTHKTGDQMVAAQFMRFVATGAVTSVVQFGVFLLLFRLGDQLANLAGVVLSSMLANEMHRRLTFRSHGRVTWLAAQWEGGGLSVAALAATSTALMLLDDVVSEAWWARVLLIAAVNAIAGSIRFRVAAVVGVPRPPDYVPRIRANCPSVTSTAG